MRSSDVPIATVGVSGRLLMAGREAHDGWVYIARTGPVGRIVRLAP